MIVAGDQVLAHIEASRRLSVSESTTRRMVGRLSVLRIRQRALIPVQTLNKLAEGAA